MKPHLETWKLSGSPWLQSYNETVQYYFYFGTRLVLQLYFVIFSSCCIVSFSKRCFLFASRSKINSSNIYGVYIKIILQEQKRDIHSTNFLLLHILNGQKESSKSVSCGCSRALIRLNTLAGARCSRALIRPNTLAGASLGKAVKLEESSSCARTSVPRWSQKPYPYEDGVGTMVAWIRPATSYYSSIASWRITLDV